MDEDQHAKVKMKARSADHGKARFTTCGRKAAPRGGVRAHPARSPVHRPALVARDLRDSSVPALTMWIWSKRIAPARKAATASSSPRSAR
jgi:hypothetical protein